MKRLCRVVGSSVLSTPGRPPPRPGPHAGGRRRRARRADPHDPDARTTPAARPRMTAELNDGAPPEQRVNHKRVARVMREHGIRRLPATPPGRHHDPRAGRPAVPDLLDRDFTAAAPNRVYVGDITYLPLADGDEPVPGHRDRLLLPAAGRLVDRRPHAHRPGRRRADDAARAPAAAWPGRSSTPTTARSTPPAPTPQLCARSSGVTQSMGAVGTSADNAVAESFNATLKREILQDAWRPGPTSRPAGARSSAG